MTYYVKLLGDGAMPDRPWTRAHPPDATVRFPSSPAPSEIRPGDELVYYAVGGSKRIFATARVESAPVLGDIPPNDRIAKKWPYVVEVSLRPSTKLEYVSSGPLLSDVDHALQEKVRHGVSHFEIGREQFRRAMQLLERAKTDESRRLR